MVTLLQYVQKMHGMNNLKFFNFVARLRWVVNVTPRETLPPGKRPGTYFTGDWVIPRAGLNGCGKSLPYWDLIP